MAQEQRIVPLILMDGSRLEAIATGNNASWLCVCRRSQPLVGRSGLVSRCTDGTRVECPDCGRSYWVIPAGGDRKRVLKVEEVVRQPSR
jgi:hypothetical protein